MVVRPDSFTRNFPTDTSRDPHRITPYADVTAFLGARDGNYLRLPRRRQRTLGKNEEVNAMSLC